MKEENASIREFKELRRRMRGGTKLSVAGLLLALVSIAPVLRSGNFSFPLICGIAVGMGLYMIGQARVFRAMVCPMCNKGLDLYRNMRTLWIEPERFRNCPHCGAQLLDD